MAKGPLSRAFGVERLERRGMPKEEAKPAEVSKPGFEEGNKQVGS